MKTVKILSSLLVVLVLCAFTINTDKSVDNGYDIGDIATDFSLKNIDGKMVSLADYKNAKGFIVIFTCNTCPYAVAYEDRIVELDKKVKKSTHSMVRQKHHMYMCFKKRLKEMK